MLEGKQLFIFDFHKISSIHPSIERNKKEKKKENVKTSIHRNANIHRTATSTAIEKFNP